jgi:hypothetical protein
LRKSLSHGRETDPIRTVRGLGYAFDERFGSPRLVGAKMAACDLVALLTSDVELEGIEYQATIRSLRINAALTLN